MFWLWVVFFLLSLFFLQTQHHCKSKGLALGKHYAAPLLKCCPRICLVSPWRGEDWITPKKAGKFNVFFFQSSGLHVCLLSAMH